MSGFVRGSVNASTHVDVDPDEFWKLLRDWPAVMSWVLPEGTIPPEDVVLKEGHTAESIPCTRVMIQKTATDYSHEETLIFADAEARRVYYTFNGVPGGIRNYMATTVVDSDGQGGAVIGCSSSFDLPSSQSMAQVEEYLLDAYTNYISRGIEGAIKARHLANS